MVMRKLFGVMALAALVLPAGVAKAQSTAIQLNGQPDGYSTMNLYIPSQGVNDNWGVPSGGIGYTTFGNAGNPVPTGFNDVAGGLFWCSDILQTENTAQQNYSWTQIGGSFTANGGVALGSNGNATTTQLTDLLYYGTAFLNSGNNSSGGTVSAALQLAIWAMLYDGTGAFSSLTNSANRFYVGNVNSTVLTDAQDFLACVVSGAAETGICSGSQWNQTVSGASVYNFALTSSQDMLRLSYNATGGGGNGGTPTPEPASMALLGAGLVGLGAVRRRFAAKRG
jgi:hypothetical protein